MIHGFNHLLDWGLGIRIAPIMSPNSYAAPALFGFCSNNRIESLTV